jgi:glc operon protein GlcG
VRHAPAANWRGFGIRADLVRQPKQAPPTREPAWRAITNGGNMSRIKLLAAALSAVSIAASSVAPMPAQAQATAPAAPQTPAPPPPASPYGAPISFTAAKKAMAAAEAEALKNKWNVAIAIVDTTGALVMFQRFDNTSVAVAGIAEGKARTALEFRRPTKSLQDTIAGGGVGLRMLALHNATPLEGGVPVVVEGKTIGAIGVSGVTSEQDAQIAKAGADSLVQ